LDLQLHLLDRQVVDPAGRLVCKVDDLELVESGGRLLVTAILAGPRALGPRLGGRLGRGITGAAARLSTGDIPRIDFGQVTDIGTVLRVARTVPELDLSAVDDWLAEQVIGRIPGAGPARPDPPARPSATGPDKAGGAGTRGIRAGELLGAEVLDSGGGRVGVVTDLRCVQDGPVRGAMAVPRVTALLVSRRHTGSLLGYDRRSQQGPWLIRVIVRALHRHLIEVPWSAVTGYTDGVRLSVRGLDLPAP
jgi:sporulation protein YlmC with PRC-barrel domain